MKKRMIRLISTLLLMAFVLGSIASCGPSSSHTQIQTSNSQAKEAEEAAQLKELRAFYDTVCNSQKILDRLADAIYQEWYGAVFSQFGSVSSVVSNVHKKNKDDFEKAEQLDKEIQSLFITVKNGPAAAQVRDVMTAYTDYYELVINISGTFASYSKNKEDYKKALANALKFLSYEV